MPRSPVAVHLWLAAVLAAGCSPSAPDSGAEEGGTGTAGEAAGGQGTGDAAGGGGEFTFPVTFVEIGGGTVEETVEFAGDVASRRHAALAFERAGRIAAMLADEGERVEQGQALARLDDRVLQAELAAARAQVQAARARTEYAEQELSRFREMGEAAPEADRDQWRSEVAIRTATWEQRKAEAMRLERLVEQSTLHAPFPGVIVARHQTLGSYARTGDLVFELVDVQRREVRVELPQHLAVGLEAGIPVEIRSEALDGASITAQLDVVLPSAEPDARTFTGLVRLGPDQDPRGRLLPGSFVHARMTARRAESDTVVPADALVEIPGGWAVVVAGGGDDGPPRARFVPVQVLARTADRVAVKPLEEGALQAGARVVVTGSDNVFPQAPLLLQPHRDPATDGRGALSADEDVEN